MFNSRFCSPRRKWWWHFHQIIYSKQGRFAGTEVMAVSRCGWWHIGLLFLFTAWWVFTDLLLILCAPCTDLLPRDHGWTTGTDALNISLSAACYLWNNNKTISLRRGIYYTQLTKLVIHRYTRGPVIIVFPWFASQPFRYVLSSVRIFLATVCQCQKSDLET